MSRSSWRFQWRFIPAEFLSRKINRNGKISFQSSISVGLFASYYRNQNVFEKKNVIKCSFNVSVQHFLVRQWQWIFVSAIKINTIQKGNDLIATDRKAQAFATHNRKVHLAHLFLDDQYRKAEPMSIPWRIRTYTHTLFRDIHNRPKNQLRKL